MKKKSEAHETLSLLLKRNGAPTSLVSDGAKDETQGEFRQKAREANIHCRETEPHSPWQNRAKGCIHFWDTSVTFPDNKEILGQYLGPAPDIGPAMAARILKLNSEVVVRSTLCTLLPEELLREKEIEERTRFDKAIYARWGPAAKPGNFEEDLDIETPTFEPYEDDET
jgi:hypothetical protein